MLRHPATMSENLCGRPVQALVCGQSFTTANCEQALRVGEVDAHSEESDWTAKRQPVE